MIYDSADARRLAIARIAILALWLWEVGSDPFERLAALPSAWFEAHGPWLLLPDQLVEIAWRPSTLQGLKLFTLACLALALLGAPGARRWLIAGTALLVLSTGFVRGFGHVDHAHVQMLFVTIVLAATPAWDALALRRASPERARSVYQASFLALALAFAFPYFETAAHRLAREGLGMFFGSSILHFMARDTLSLDDFDFSFGLRLVEHAEWLPLYNLAFGLVTVAEGTAPWVHLRRSACIAWLGLIVPFHLLAPVIMHVWFGPNLALLGLLYLWPLLWRTGCVAGKLPGESRSD